MKTIGVLGGMGPVATAEYFQRMLALCQRWHGAVQDGEYPPILVYSMSLQGSSESGIKDTRVLEREFVRGARRLVSAGSDFLVIPCNTAHHYIDRLRRAVSVPIPSIVELTVDELERRGVRSVAVLASDSSEQHALYDRPLEARGIRPVGPRAREQRELTRTIEHIMGGLRTHGDRQALIRIVRRMRADDGVDAAIVGCTELSLVLPTYAYSIPTVDALDMLAEEAVRRAYESSPTHDVPSAERMTATA
ncbi:MAG TPA: amino acid racemase [Thermoplasmata archaeon]|nr:amino acid racemase [Thermoplasmata archaeon]